ncbi:hypothetical protein [Paraliobacillus sp. X-1268]|nr:hypothetical protein [Paraliobacillus sp. X-1268]
MKMDINLIEKQKMVARTYEANDEKPKPTEGQYIALFMGFISDIDNKVD